MKFHSPVRIFFSTLLASPVKNFQLSRSSAVSGLALVFNSTRVRRSTFSSAMLRIGTTFLFLSSATGAGWLCRAIASLRRLSRRPDDRLDDCVVNGIPAMDTMRFAYRAKRTTDSLLKGLQAIRAGD